MPKWEFEFPHDTGQRGEDDDVGDDVVDGVRVPKGRNVDAGGSGVGSFVPEVWDGVALKDGDDDGGQGVGGDDNDAGPARAAEPGLGEDAQVEAEDGELGEVYGEFVEDLVEVEHLLLRREMK